MKKDEGQALRAEVLKATRAKAGGPYPAALRARLIAYVMRRCLDGATVREVAKELGVSHHTVAFWRSSRREKVVKSVKPVRVVAESTDPNPAKAGLVNLVHPSGLRVEGLTLDQAAVLLRRMF